MSKRLQIAISGNDLINTPLLNKGTAFTERERDLFDLHGLLPPNIGTLQEQVDRRLLALDLEVTDFNKYSFLRDLQDMNETLFYALLVRDIEQALPLVYTPTVGEGCQRFSEIWRKPRGLFLSYPNRARMRQILSHPRYDDVRCIVVSDGERILGLGDQGAGGMGIPIGKLALYSALGGIHPQHCLPILLDVGTDNRALLDNPLYVGWDHERIRGAEYDDFVDSFVRCVQERWPDVLLQWEDFAGANATRLLERYRDQLCTFNDDIQGTAAVAAATLMSAIRRTGLGLGDQRIVVVGFGSAGLGIANLLVRWMVEEGIPREDARRSIYAVDRDGLITESSRGLRPEQLAYGRPDHEMHGWPERGLPDVVRMVKPTVLIGVSGQHGVFDERSVREMAAHTVRPVIFPLSNPTSRCEATPLDLLHWTGGHALIGTGSPFDPVAHGDRTHEITQTNNAYIFPGLALGVIAAHARRVTDGMIMAAARELARLALSQPDAHGKLLPPISELRTLSRSIALAVCRAAIREGQSQLADAEVEGAVDRELWHPVYADYERVSS